MTKAAQLKRHKTLATCLLILMVGIYLLMVFLLKERPAPWMGFVRAFAEAGVVGALADWFAVTALFHHPMGIPIPHTNLIERKKAAIGQNLGGFVVDNFLTPEVLRPYFEKLDAAKMMGQFLSSERSRAAIIEEGLTMAKAILEKTSDQAAVDFLKSKGMDLLKSVHLGPTLGSAMDMLLTDGQDQRLLDYLLDKLKYYIAENEDLVRARVKKQSGFLVPGFVDNMLANRITVGLAEYIHEIHSTPDHPMRGEIRNRLRMFSSELKTGEKYEAEINRIKDNLLSSQQVQNYWNSAWSYLKKMLLRELETTGKKENQSQLEKYLDKQIIQLAEKLQNDPSMSHKVNEWVRLNAYRLALRNREQVGSIISKTVANWEGSDLSEKLEMEVGKDLQYIRINGTVVGGLVGLLIYSLSLLI